jgi:hypothetical protein
MRYANRPTLVRWLPLALVAGCAVDPDAKSRRGQAGADDPGAPTVAIDGDVPPPAVDQTTLAKLDTPEGRTEVEARGWFKDDKGALVRYDAVRGQWDKQDDAPSAGLSLTGATFFSTWERADDEGLGLATYATVYALRPATYSVMTTNRYAYSVASAVSRTPVYRAPTTTSIVQYGVANTSVVRNPATTTYYNVPATAAAANPLGNPTINARPTTTTVAQNGVGNTTIVNNNNGSAGCLGYMTTSHIGANGQWITDQVGPCTASYAFGPAANINIVNGSNTVNGSFNNTNSNVSTTVAGGNNGHSTASYNNGGTSVSQNGVGNTTIVNNNGGSSGCLGYNYTMTPRPGGGYNYTQGVCGASYAFGPAANINIVTSNNNVANAFNNTNSNVNTGASSSTGSHYTPTQPGEQRAGNFTPDVAAFREEAIQQCGHLPAYYWLSANGQKTVRC